MTRKAAMANIYAGGGKGVIIASQKQKTEKLLRAYAKFVDHFNGRFSTGEDVGITVEDAKLMRKETPYVFGILHDPSPFTALGVLRGMKVCANHVYGDQELSKLSIAIQGAGHVGQHLARDLFASGVPKDKLFISDINKELMRHVEAVATWVPVEDILSIKCNIFAPCALGGIVNSETIPNLKCDIIAGSANNQLLDSKHGYELLKKGVVYAPDYVINAGGLLYVYSEMNNRMDAGSLTSISDSVKKIIETSKTCGEPTNVVADKLADDKIKGIEESQNRGYWV